MSQTQFYLIISVTLVVIAGVGEYLHLLPLGTFSNMLFAVFGLAVGVFVPPPTQGGGSVVGERNTLPPEGGKSG